MSRPGSEVFHTRCTSLVYTKFQVRLRKKTILFPKEGMIQEIGELHILWKPARNLYIANKALLALINNHILKTYMHAR